MDALSIGQNAGKIWRLLDHNRKWEYNELKAETAYAAVSGFGRIQCHAKKQLSTTTSGNGKIYYSGNPEIKHSGTKKPQKL